MSFVDKMMIQRGDKKVADMLLILFSDDDGVQRYAYVLVRPERMDAFRKVMASGAPFHLEYYCTVLEHGEGTPNEDTKKWMYDVFGFDKEPTPFSVEEILKEISENDES